MPSSGVWGVPKSNQYWLKSFLLSFVSRASKDGAFTKECRWIEATLDEYGTSHGVCHSSHQDANRPRPRFQRDHSEWTYPPERPGWTK